MARVPGALIASSNYELSVRKPFDARSLVTEYTDLTDEATWRNKSGRSIAYNGMVVAVINTEHKHDNGVYYFFDINYTALKGGDVTKQENWRKLANIDEVFSLEERVSELQELIETTQEDLMAELSALRDEIQAAGYLTQADLVNYATRSELQNYAPLQALLDGLATKVDTATLRHADEGIKEGVSVEGTVLNIVIDAYTREETDSIVSDVETKYDPILPAITELRQEALRIAKYAEETQKQVDANTATFQNYVSNVDLATTLAKYYTAEQVDATVEANKYDDSAIASAVAKNTAAIDILNGDASVQGSVRSIAADEINTLIGGVTDKDTIDNIKTLVDYVNANGAEIARVLDGIGGEGNPATVLEAIDVAIDAIPQTPIATTQEAGLVKASDEVSVDADGSMRITKVSVNCLEQSDDDILYIHGGNATGKTTT